MLAGFDVNQLNDCADIFYNVFTAPQWGYTWLTRDNVRRYFTDLVNTPMFRGYMYYTAGRLTGCCLGAVSDYFNSCQYIIKEIFIDTDFQGAGHGGLFLKEIECDLASINVDSITLSTTRGIKAHDFYLKNGFLESPGTVFMVKFLKRSG